MNSVTPSLQPQQTAYFPALTGVRALAAYLVFFYHFPPISRNSIELVQYFLEGCYAGVTIFFVLSGFLISYKYSSVFKENIIGYKKYLLFRFARIYPLYFVLTVFTLIWLKNTSLGYWLVNLALLNSFFYTTGSNSGIGQAWSLTVEESFYILAPLLFLSFRKIGIATILVLILLGAGIVFFSFKTGSTEFMPNYERMFSSTFFGRCFEFYCGHLLAKFVKRKAIIPKSSLFFTLSGSLLVISGIMLVGYTTMIVHVSSIKLAVISNNFLLPAAIIIWFYGLISEKTKLSVFLGSKPLSILGKCSYAFYLIHAGWFYETIFFHITQHVIFIFLILNFCSITIYYLFEEPVNKYLRKKIELWDLKKSLPQPDFLKQKA